MGTIYRSLYRSAGGNMESLAQSIPQFLATSGLHRRSLREVWTLANPEQKSALGPEEFARACRLIAHCQALQQWAQVSREGPAMQELLQAGGRPLRVYLRERVLFKPPSRPPQFRSSQ